MLAAARFSMGSDLRRALASQSPGPDLVLAQVVVNGYGPVIWAA